MWIHTFRVSLPYNCGMCVLYKRVHDVRLKIGCIDLGLGIHTMHWKLLTGAETHHHHEAFRKLATFTDKLAAALRIMWCIKNGPGVIGVIKVDPGFIQSDNPLPFVT